MTPINTEVTTRAHTAAPSIEAAVDDVAERLQRICADMSSGS